MTKTEGSPEHIAAMTKVRDLAIEYETRAILWGVTDETLVPGHPLYDAVIELKAFSGGHVLPEDGQLLWTELLKDSDSPPDLRN